MARGGPRNPYNSPLRANTAVVLTYGTIKDYFLRNPKNEEKSSGEVGTG